MFAFYEILMSPVHMLYLLNFEEMENWIFYGPGQRALSFKHMLKYATTSHCKEFIKVKRKKQIETLNEKDVGQKSNQLF